MTTIEKIEQDYTSALKAREASVVSTLRMLRASLKNAKIEKMADLSESEAMTVISKEVKKLKDSRETFIAGSRKDLADSVDVELALLANYMPKELDDAELTEIVKQVIANFNGDKSNMGQVMAEVMKVVASRASGGRISAIVKQILSS